METPKDMIPSGGIFNREEPVVLDKIPHPFDMMVQALFQEDECKHEVRKTPEGEYRCQLCKEKFGFI